jgi:hypothetical protein
MGTPVFLTKLDRSIPELATSPEDLRDSEALRNILEQFEGSTVYPIINFTGKDEESLVKDYLILDALKKSLDSFVIPYLNIHSPEPKEEKRILVLRREGAREEVIEFERNMTLEQFKRFVGKKDEALIEISEERKMRINDEAGFQSIGNEHVVYFEPVNST